MAGAVARVAEALALLGNELPVVAPELSVSSSPGGALRSLSYDRLMILPVMDIGVMVGGNGLEAVLAAVRDAADAGVRRAWLPQVFSGEALTIIAVAGREIPDIEFGTAVIPTYPRHPLVLADQALTTSAALGGARLHLGIGLSHQLVIEGMLGMAFEKPAIHMREYLSALRPALDGQPVAVKGRDAAGQHADGAAHGSTAPGPSPSSWPPSARHCCGWRANSPTGR